jgi:predicted ATPase
MRERRTSYSGTVSSVVALKRLEVEGYRSLRDLSFDLSNITVILGENGAGKTNLYQCLRLVHAAASGALARTIADEGGMPSVLWAGAVKSGPRRVRVRVNDDAWAYEMALGLPTGGGGSGSMFSLDPLVKSERAWLDDGRRAHLVLERANFAATARDCDGARVEYPTALDQSESILSQVSDPHRFPVLSALRQTVLRWRFYHQLRVDAGAPSRRPCAAIRTFAMSPDGADLAAAWQTVLENGDGPALSDALSRALPGTRVDVQEDRGMLSLAVTVGGVQRALDGREWSDGTLRLLCLFAALYSPRPPSLLALNEPEASLHPSTLAPLAEAAAFAARGTQLWITTHSRPFADALGSLEGATVFVASRGADGTSLRAL